MKEGKLKNGFKYEVDEAVLDDMELIDAIAGAQTGNPAMVSGVVLSLLGKEQRDKLYEHVRGENGRVSATEIVEIVAEIFEALGEQGKN